MCEELLQQSGCAHHAAAFPDSECLAPLVLLTNAALQQHQCSDGDWVLLNSLSRTSIIAPMSAAGSTSSSTMQQNGRPRAPQGSSQEMSELNAQFNDVFSLRKPKDAKAGLSSGAKSIGKGVLAGAVGLFAAPVVLAREEGAKGFAKGVAVGGWLREIGR